MSIELHARSDRGTDRRRFTVRGSLRLGLVLAAATALATGAEPQREAPARATGPSEETRRMALRLEVIAETTNPWANPYVNAQRIAMLQALPVPAEPEERIRRRVGLAQELLRGGNAAEAVKLLRELQRSVGEPIRALTALALLRAGEQENCIERHTTESCLLPIRGAGVYGVRDHTAQAFAEYRALLERDPADGTSRWLLNVAAMALGEYPASVPERFRIPPAVFESEYDIGRFPDAAPRLGLDVMGQAGGAIVDDLDGDGDLDILTSSSGLRDPLRFLRNEGNGSFVDRTEAAHLGGITGGLNLIHADYDNDGAIDVFVLRGAWLGVRPATDGGRHPNSLLRNNGDGTFDDVTESAGLLDFMPTQTAAWADFDLDGRLDLFVGNESFAGQLNPCKLFRNRGDGTFEDVAASAGVDVLGLVKAVVWGDYDDDGRPDLFVSRLGAANLLFHNDGPNAAGAWRFTDVAAVAGVTEPLASFPAWFFDYDNDGRLDLFVSGYAVAGGGSLASAVLADYLGQPSSAERPRLYRNAGKGRFEDVTAATGLNRVLFTMGCNFGDLDNDGFSDLYLGTGDPDLRALVPNRMFRNAAGVRFQDVTTSGGFGHLQKGHGIAFADLDHDGDQDVYHNLGGFFSGDVYPNALFENPGHGNRWLKLELVGVRSNRSAIGARVVVRIREGAAAREIHTTVSTGGSFGGSPLRREIGLARADAVEHVRVRWPSGEEQRFTGLQLDRAYRLREGDAQPRPLTLAPFALRGTPPRDAAPARHHGH